MLACPDGNSGNPFEGMWNGVDSDRDAVTMNFGPTSWSLSWPAVPALGSRVGNYTYEGNTATLRNVNGVLMGTATVSGNTMSANLPQVGITAILTK